MTARSHDIKETPCIYSTSEVNTLLQQSKSDHLPIHSHPRSILATFIALLYTTGVRVSEARNVNIGDIELTQSLIHIRAGKYHKERWVTLSSSMLTMLSEYLKDRIKVSPNDDGSALFISTRKQRVSHSFVYHNFQKLLALADIKGLQQRRPTLKSFRHTFAVHRLLQWYREGEDVNAKLPILATYMGHVNIISTQVYLHSTPELMEQVDKRFYQHYTEQVK
ncbi:MAG: tyrosine-type recombinase/integrase [Pseudomonadales bacterium]